MAATISRALLRFFIPGGLLLLGAILTIHNQWIHELPPAVRHLAPYMVAGGGILLGWRFNRSKLVFAILALFTVERLLTLPSATVTQALPLITQAAGVLLPLNLAYYALMSERGFLTTRGIIRLVLFGLQPFLVFALHKWRPTDLQKWLTMPLPHLHLPSPLTITDPAFCAFAISFLLILLAYARRRSAMENAFLWATACSFMALAVTREPDAISIFLTMAGLALIVGVIETAHSMAFRDQLTGLPGRRALEEALLKLGNRYTIAMLDIDFFKKFNDTYGHDVGDQVLRMVASRIAHPGGGGKAFRYGGEEFTVLFNGKDAQEALPHLERLRKTIETSGFALRSGKRSKNDKNKRGKNKGSDRKVSVTISIGAANRHPTGTTDPQSVIKAADKALYKAKKGGRNQVACA